MSSLCLSELKLPPKSLPPLRVKIATKTSYPSPSENCHQNIATTLSELKLPPTRANTAAKMSSTLSEWKLPPKYPHPLELTLPPKPPDLSNRSVNFLPDEEGSTGVTCDRGVSTWRPPFSKTASEKLVKKRHGTEDRGERKSRWRTLSCLPSPQPRKSSPLVAS